MSVGEMAALHVLFHLSILDPGAHPAARAGAAVALSTDASGETRHRLQIAAQATAAPRVRMAIETAARNQEQCLAQVLAELEADDAART